MLLKYVHKCYVPLLTDSSGSSCKALGVRVDPMTSAPKNREYIFKNLIKKAMKSCLLFFSSLFLILCF